MVILACVASLATAEVLPATDAQIQSWIRQLDSDEWSVRAQAEEELGKVGPRAATLVTAALATEMRADAMMTLRVILRRYREQMVTQPLPVRMNSAYPTGLSAWRELAKHAGLEFVAPTHDELLAKLGSRVEFASDHDTWAKVRHRLETQTGVEAVVVDNRLTLAKPSRVHIAPPADWSLPMVVSVGRPEQGQREWVIPLTLDFDPGLRFEFVGPMFRCTEINAEGQVPVNPGRLGESGQSYSRVGRSKHLGTYRVMVPWQIREVPKLSLIRGELTGRVVTNWRTFESRVVLGETAVVGEDEDALRVTLVAAGETGWEMRITDAEGAHSASEQIMRWYIASAHRLEVLDKAGRPFAIKVDRVSTRRTPAHIPLTQTDSLLITVQRDASDRDRAPATVRWVAPSELIDVTFPFELRDIELRKPIAAPGKPR